MQENEQEVALAQDASGITFVKSSTPTKSLAVFITTSATKDKLEGVKIRGIGAGAVNQMVKAVITAKSRLGEKGITLTWDAYYKDVESRESGDGNISAVEFSITFKGK